jgi:bacterioferritin-associated ferredoxin
MTTEEEVRARMKPGCICKGIKLYRIIEAMDQGAATFEEVAAITGIGGGSCNSKRCGEKVRELLRLKKDLTG